MDAIGTVRRALRIGTGRACVRACVGGEETAMAGRRECAALTCRQFAQSQDIEAMKNHIELVWTRHPEHAIVCIKPDSPTPKAGPTCARGRRKQATMNGKRSARSARRRRGGAAERGGEDQASYSDDSDADPDFTCSSARWC